jgi:hypothetical protein
MRIWELRKKKGLPFDEKDPEQQVIMLPAAGKYATNVKTAAPATQPPAIP